MIRLKIRTEWRGARHAPLTEIFHMAVSLYPPNPPNVPDYLTQPTSQYKTQIVLVLLSLALFFLLYFGILVFCVLFFLWTIACFFIAGFQQGPGPGAGLAVLGVVQLALCLPLSLLFLYMLKNVFRWSKKEKTDHVEIFEHEHPKLFDFIYRVCDDTGAPYPKRVFVNYEVNAMAFNEGDSFWHLFIPSQKNLLIGLGLVNGVNLTEFKALLAHEFGHFSQKSTKLGAYVYTAFGIINQIVDGYDFFDRFIDGWCRLAPSVAFPAWIVYGVLWILRRVLMGLRYVMFFFHRGLSRQMEFNADLVAVSVTGSDAPVHLLYRCTFADRCLGHSLSEIQTALDHHLYTEDLFYHQSHAATYIRRREKKPNLGEPPSLPADLTQTSKVFEPEDDEQATMWSTHPANYERERNAKEFYIRSEFDERSPWLLFDQVEQLRADVTYKFYRFYHKAPKTLVQVAAEEIQAFIDEEHAETTYDPKYQGMYDYRNLVLGDIYDLAQEGRRTPWPIAQLSQSQATLYNAEAKHRGQLYNKRLEEHNLLLAVSKGWHRPKNHEVEFRGELYDPEDAKRLLRKVEKELEHDQAWLADLDRRVFMTHFQMALHINQETAEELFKRYRFHLDLQKIWKELKDQDAPVGAAVNFLQNLRGTQLETHHFQEALSIFREAHHVLRDALLASEVMRIPALKNMPAGESLRDFLLQKRLVEGLSKYEQSLNSKWIGKLLDQMSEVQKKVDRIHFKSLGGILALQERIAQECLDRWSQLPAVLPLTSQPK
jgi:Zn-dependent protease with chaperone function